MLCAGCVRIVTTMNLFSTRGDLRVVLTGSREEGEEMANPWYLDDRAQAF